MPEIANRKQGLEWLGVLGKGKHLEGDITHLRKACAMIIEPYSSGMVPFSVSWYNLQNRVKA